MRIAVSLLDTSQGRLICDEQVAKLIDNPEWLNQPIRITKDRVVVNGNHRVEAFKRLGRDEIDAIEE